MNQNWRTEVEVLGPGRNPAALDDERPAVLLAVVHADRVAATRRFLRRPLGSLLGNRRFEALVGLLDVGDELGFAVFPGTRPSRR